MTSENLRKYTAGVNAECVQCNQPTLSLSNVDNVDFLLNLAKFENSKESKKVISELTTLLASLRSK